MRRIMLSGEISGVTVTQADLHYVGSVTVDADLLDAAGMVEGEVVDIVDSTNGARLTTYTIRGDAGTGILGINGAAAHLVQPGDVVSLVSFVECEPADLAGHRPRIVRVDAHNRAIPRADDTRNDSFNEQSRDSLQAVP